MASAEPVKVGVTALSCASVRAVPTVADKVPLAGSPTTMRPRAAVNSVQPVGQAPLKAAIMPLGTEDVPPTVTTVEPSPAQTPIEAPVLVIVQIAVFGMHVACAWKQARNARSERSFFT